MKYLCTLIILPIIWGLAVVHRAFQLNLNSWYGFPLLGTYAIVALVAAVFIVDRITK